MSEKQLRIPIGISDFREMREDGYYYIDKSHFIEEICESGAKVVLLPRPRRFGKTLNLTMLKYFFEINEKDQKHLFEKLYISASDTYEKHQGRYPVIYLTFKDLKDRSWNAMLEGIQHLLRDEFFRHEQVLNSEHMSEAEKEYFRSMVAGKASLRECTDALRYLSSFLFRFYGKRAVILIDEYDTPVHAAFENGYYDEVVSFLRNFLGGGLKDNSHLYKGVITGILRIAKESVFSDLNNLGVHTLTGREYQSSFGFTDGEVRILLENCGLSKRYGEVSCWYNGYLFGETVIYNPWSVLNFTVSKPEIPYSYWINTGGTEMIDRLTTHGGRELKEEIGLLLEGRTVCKPIYESIVMRDLEKRDDLLWSFLLFSGYLKAVRQTDSEKWELKIPNREVHVMYREMVKRWFSVKTESARIEAMLTALKNGDAETFEFYLADTVERVLSVHDTGGPEPEKFYHAFVLGLLVWLEGEYDIRSNREAGLGRYDMMLMPKDKSRHGIVMEFKKVNERKKETPEQALEKALKQMEEKKYVSELEAAGIKNILKLAIVFQGKELWMKQG
ncbi:MAG: AAA family ATPase [Desulfococcaceae bacterium]|jgi:hypothetical protein|nr:AAA family ATPase [Desulfococcaceae bacterium]